MTVGQLYTRTCDAYSRKPNDGQLDSWEAVLGDYTIAEVKKAIELHQADLTPNSYDGRPQGSHMPQAADLKRIIEASKKQAVAARWRRCGRPECHDGWIFIPGQDRVRRCEECHSLRQVAV